MHVCDEQCECRVDLEKAAEALASASRLLADSTKTDCTSLMEACWASVRAAKARFHGAHAAYLDHLAPSSRT